MLSALTLGKRGAYRPTKQKFVWCQPPVSSEARGLVLQQELTNRRADIVRIAAGVFAQRGYRGTTMRHIADAAGILPGSLYHHFASKEEILREVIEQSTADYVERLEALAGTDLPASEQVRRAVRDRLELYRERGIALIVVLQTDRGTMDLPVFDGQRELGKRIDRAWDCIISRGVRSGEFRPDLDVRATSYAIVGMLNWAHRWFDPDGRLGPAALADQWASLVLAGAAIAQSPPATSLPLGARL